jgi:hypothetical protein
MILLIWYDIILVFMVILVFTVIIVIMVKTANKIRMKKFEWKIGKKFEWYYEILQSQKVTSKIGNGWKNYQIEWIAWIIWMKI